MSETNFAAIEANQRELKVQLKEVGDQLKKHAEASEAAVKRAGDIGAEAKAQVDKLLAEQSELTARLAAAEQIVAKLDSGERTFEVEMSPGQIVAVSDEFKAFDEGRGGKGRFTVKMKSLQMPQAVITEGSNTSGGAMLEPMRVPGVDMLPNQRLTIRALLSWGRTTVPDIEFVRETGFTNNADVVSENPASGKPESNITYEVDSAKVATIAHWIHASKQVLSDVGQLQGYIDNRLRYGLAYKEELQLLKGSGVGLNINGLYTQATAYSNPGVNPASVTRVDLLRLALLQAELAEYYPDGLVLNPIDWVDIELKKDANNRYLFANPFGGMIIPMLWGRPVVATKSMSQNDFLVGAFKQGAQGWDREDASVTVSTEDRDNFIKNMVTILAEERIGLTVYRPEAFVKGDFITDGSSNI